LYNGSTKTYLRFKETRPSEVTHSGNTRSRSLLIPIGNLTLKMCKGSSDEEAYMTGLMGEANALNTASLQGWVTTSPGMPSLRPRWEEFNDLEREEAI
jgi:hypothetical protein